MLGSRLFPFVLTAAAIVAATTATAAAAPTDQEKGLAETLFRDGKTLMAAGKYEEACPKLAASDGYDPQIGTILNLALCYESEGKTASAWAEFTEAASRADKLGQTDRASFARQHAVALEAKLSRVQVVVKSPAPSLSVKIDDAPIASSAWGVALPLDPGPHRIEASAPGKTTNVQTFTVTGQKAVAPVEVAELLDAPTPAATGHVTPGADEAHGMSTMRVLGYVGLGIGVVGVGLGSVFGIETITKKNAANRDNHCSATFCDSVGIADQNASHTDATVSTIAFAGGLAAAAAGVLLIVAAPSHDTDGAPKAAWWIAPEGAGVAAGGLW